MGQEESYMVGDDVKPETLSERSLAGVAEMIKSGQASKIVVLAGAGISTAAGSIASIYPFPSYPSSLKLCPSVLCAH